MKGAVKMVLKQRKKKCFLEKDLGLNVMKKISTKERFVIIH